MRNAQRSIAFRGIAPARLVVALLVASTMLSCARGIERPDPLESLFTAERAFARQSVNEGMRAAFLAHFDEDGVVFWPAPITVRDAFAEAPPSPNAMASTLDWGPMAGGVARSGEIGFTTGPWVRTDATGASPPRHGVFFSIWRKGGDERWRVVADAGARTTAPVSHALLAPGPKIGPSGDDDRSGLLAAEDRIGNGAQYASLFASDAMFASDATGILRGDAIGARYRDDAATLRLVTLHASVARSGDVGYTYGRHSHGAASGYYLHLWTRDTNGAWRIAVATHQAQP